MKNNKVIKSHIVTFLSWALFLYVVLFLLWYLMMLACLQSVGVNSCGGDSLTSVVRTIHSPIINILLK